MSYLREALERQRRVAQDARDERAIEGHLVRGEAIPFNLRELYLLRNFEQALAHYRSQPWNGRATLFRVDEVAYFLQGGGRTYGWDRDVLGGVDIIILPANHSTLLISPNAELLVRSLSAAIDRVGRLRPELAGTPRAAERA